MRPATASTAAAFLPSASSSASTASSSPLPPLGINPHASPSLLAFLSLSHAFVAIVVVPLQIAATAVAASHSDSESPDRVYSTSSAGAGVWAGVLFLTTGVVGGVAARRRSNCHLTAFLVLAVVDVFPLAAVLVATTSHDLSERDYQFCNHRFAGHPCSRAYSTMVSLNVGLLCAALLESVVAVASVAAASTALHRGRGCACCCGCCYDDDDAGAASPLPQSFVFYAPPPPPPPPPMEILNGGVVGGHGYANAILDANANGFVDGNANYRAGFVGATAPPPVERHFSLVVTANGEGALHAGAAPSYGAISGGGRADADQEFGEVFGQRRLVVARSPPPSYEESQQR